MTQTQTRKSRPAQTLATQDVFATNAPAVAPAPVGDVPKPAQPVRLAPVSPLEALTLFGKTYAQIGHSVSSAQSLVMREDYPTHEAAMLEVDGVVFIACRPISPSDAPTSVNGRSLMRAGTATGNALADGSWLSFSIGQKTGEKAAKAPKAPASTGAKVLDKAAKDAAKRLADQQARKQSANEQLVAALSGDAGEKLLALLQKLGA